MISWIGCLRCWTRVLAASSPLKWASTVPRKVRELYTGWGFTIPLFAADERIYLRRNPWATPLGPLNWPVVCPERLIAAGLVP